MESEEENSINMLVYSQFKFEDITPFLKMMKKKKNKIKKR